MTAYDQMTALEQIASLEEVVIAASDFLEIEVQAQRNVNHDYNSTFKLTATDGTHWALRVNINSNRSMPNLLAEIQVVESITSVRTPKPKRNSRGLAAAEVWHEATQSKLLCIAYSWIDGSEVGDDPTEQALRAMGQAMANLHLETRNLRLAEGASLPVLDGVTWGQNELLLSTNSGLTEKGRLDVAAAYARIERTVAELYANRSAQVIHADLHSWNVMWNEGDVTVFDFDDCGWGLPIQDIATALYYLDTEQQDQAFLSGYAEVAPLQDCDHSTMQTLRMQRRLVLANFLLESSNPEHSELAPSYLVETERRLENWLSE